MSNNQGVFMKKLYFFLALLLIGFFSMGALIDEANMFFHPDRYSTSTDLNEIHNELQETPVSQPVQEAPKKAIELI